MKNQKISEYINGIEEIINAVKEKAEILQIKKCKKYCMLLQTAGHFSTYIKFIFIEKWEGDAV